MRGVSLLLIVSLLAGCGGPPVHPHSARWVWREGKRRFSSGNRTIGALYLIAAHHRLERSEFRDAKLKELLATAGYEYAAKRLFSDQDPITRLSHLAGWRRWDEYHRALRSLGLTHSVEPLLLGRQFLAARLASRPPRMRMEDAFFTLGDAQLAEEVSRTGWHIPERLLMARITAMLQVPQLRKRACLRYGIGCSRLNGSALSPFERILWASRTSGPLPSWSAQLSTTSACPPSSDLPARVRKWLAFLCGSGTPKYRSLWNEFLGDREFSLWLLASFQLPAAWAMAPQDLRSRYRRLFSGLGGCLARSENVLSWWRLVSSQSEIRAFLGAMGDGCTLFRKPKSLDALLTQGGTPWEWRRALDGLSAGDAHYAAEALAVLERDSWRHLLVAMRTFVRLHRPARASWAYDLARMASPDPYTFYENAIPLLAEARSELAYRAIREYLAWHPPAPLALATIMDAMVALGRDPRTVHVPVHDTAETMAAYVLATMERSRQELLARIHRATGHPWTPSVQDPRLSRLVLRGPCRKTVPFPALFSPLATGPSMDLLDSQVDCLNSAYPSGMWIHVAARIAMLADDFGE